MTTKIPVVDLHQIGLHHEGEISSQVLHRVAKEIREVFSEIGFVYLKNHGIPRQKIDEVHRVSGDFFSLPADVKWKSRINGHAGHRQGYSRPDHEMLSKSSVHELRESYNVGYLDGHFPPEVPEMEPKVLSLASDCQNLTMRLLKVLAISLGLEDIDFLVERHQKMFSDSNGTVMRILYYPPIPENIQENEGWVRCGDHSDYGTITFLFQDDVGGLEVQAVDKTWIPAPPIDDTILVNVGDLLQIWSGGKFPATHHRVLVPKDDVLRRKERRSLTCFIHPDDHVLVSPLDGSDTYKAVMAGESLTKRYQETYQQY